MMAKFKVGDRVRVVKHCNWLGDKNVMGVPIGEVREIVRQTAQLSDRGVDTFILNGDETYFYTPLNLEPAPSAIRTVTRREIVPGTYGAVDVETEGWLSVKFDEAQPTAGTLRAAAKLFNELADVLDEQQKEVG